MLRWTLLPLATTVLCLAGVASVAQASTGISCLLALKVKERATQPIEQVMVKGQLIEVKDDKQARNDVSCAQVFKGQKMVWVNISRKFMQDYTPKAQPGQTVWVNFTYRDDRGGAMSRDYTLISQDDYLEKQHGIQ
jgi:hypothetical protein